MGIEFCNNEPMAEAVGDMHRAPGLEGGRSTTFASKALVARRT